MFEIILAAVSVASVGAIAFLVWLWCCNDWTCEQRIAINQHIYRNCHHAEPRKLWSVFDDVTYDQHFWCLAFLRNPRKLYPDWAWPKETSDD